ncbi:MAG TPA: hypothetical protein VFS21_07530 [Roseiflexaceae bacterium]|nr:hypothetical protein [Roseiflexaceae bacterium]
MDLRIDDKGKYYTQRVGKDMLPALVRTSNQVIVGYIYTRPERRLKDELNSDESRFLPVTDARVYDATSEALLYQSSFLLVAYHQIVMVSPLDAMEHVRPVPWVQPIETPASLAIEEKDVA